jgi:hypothetical protein
VNAYEVHSMNRRIADRWRKANEYEVIPIRPPSWAAEIVDADGELLAVHAVTAAPYPISLHSDLLPKDRAVVVGRRILAAGGTVDEIIRFFDSFELPQYARDRLVRQVREATS